MLASCCPVGVPWTPSLASLPFRTRPYPPFDTPGCALYANFAADPDLVLGHQEHVVDQPFVPVNYVENSAYSGCNVEIRREDIIIHINMTLNIYTLLSLMILAHR